MGSFHLRPPVFAMPSDASLPIIDLTYRLVLEVDRAVGDLPRNQRPGQGRRGEAAAFDLLEALGAARYARGPEKQAHLAGAYQALNRLRLPMRSSYTRETTSSQASDNGAPSRVLLESTEPGAMPVGLRYPDCHEAEGLREDERHQLPGGPARS